MRVSTMSQPVVCRRVSPPPQNPNQTATTRRHPATYAPPSPVNWFACKVHMRAKTRQQLATADRCRRTHARTHACVMCAVLLNHNCPLSSRLTNRARTKFINHTHWWPSNIEQPTRYQCKMQRPLNTLRAWPPGARTLTILAYQTKQRFM